MGWEFYWQFHAGDTHQFSEGRRPPSLFGLVPKALWLGAGGMLLRDPCSPWQRLPSGHHLYCENLIMEKD